MAFRWSLECGRFSSLWGLSDGMRCVLGVLSLVVNAFNASRSKYVTCPPRHPDVLRPMPLWVWRYRTRVSPSADNDTHAYTTFRRGASSSPVPREGRSRRYGRPDRRTFAAGGPLHVSAHGGVRCHVVVGCHFEPCARREPVPLHVSPCALRVRTGTGCLCRGSARST